MHTMITALVLTAVFVSVAHGADEPAAMNLWPGKPVGETRKEQPEKSEAGGGITRIGNVFAPTLTVYSPPKESNNGAAVIICPGGGYSILAWDLEGIEVANWLNKAGVTGILLKYRVPANRNSDGMGFIPLIDAQRAISFSRSKAKEWGVDPNRIGILGFSAGGHLSALACTHFEQRSYEPTDDVDQISCRPDFGVLIYPAYLVDDRTEAVSPEFKITSKMPPIFIAGASDDRITNVGSAVFYLALHRAGVPVELHLSSVGGHGYGLRPSPRPCSTWPQRCEEWMKISGLLKAK